MTTGAKDAPKAETPKPLVEKIGEPKPAEKIRRRRSPRSRKSSATARANAAAGTAKPQPKPDPIAEKLEEARRARSRSQGRRPKPLPPKKPPQKPQPKFDADKIAALLDKREPQRHAATGAELNPTPSLGTADRQRRASCRRARSTRCARG